jgi:guanylate kinase
MRLYSLGVAKVVCSLRRGILFVLSAPAGTGKTTLIHRLVKELDCVVQSISWTTREPREDEVDGRDYCFVTQKQFEEAIQKNEFIEWAKVFDNSYYGTSKAWVEAALDSGKHVFLVIDTQGAAQVRARGLGVSIFVSPPSMEELRRRLVERSTEPAEMIEKRLSFAKLEMAAAVNYDYHIVNDQLDSAYQVLRSICIAEEHRSSRILKNQ